VEARASNSGRESTWELDLKAVVIWDQFSDAYASLSMVARLQVVKTPPSSSVTSKHALRDAYPSVTCSSGNPADAHASTRIRTPPQLTQLASLLIRKQKANSEHRRPPSLFLFLLSLLLFLLFLLLHNPMASLVFC
jgi:hypothetical protein